LQQVQSPPHGALWYFLFQIPVYVCIHRYIRTYICVYIHTQAIYRPLYKYTHTHINIRALSWTLWKVQQLTLAAHVHTHTQFAVSDSRNSIWAPTAVNTTLTNRRFVRKQTIPIRQDKYFTSLHLLTQKGSYLRTSTLTRSHLVCHESSNSASNIQQLWWLTLSSQWNEASYSEIFVLIDL
jgi:hypothetical protein